MLVHLCNWNHRCSTTECKNICAVTKHRHFVQDFEKAGQLRDREMELKAQISAITGAAKETTDAEAETTAEGGGPLVTDADIANIVAQWTGIPVEKVHFSLAVAQRAPE